MHTYIQTYIFTYGEHELEREHVCKNTDGSVTAAAPAGNDVMTVLK
jgi:hypothetical protein